MEKLEYYINQLKAEIIYLPKNIGYFFSKKKRAVYIGCLGQGNLGDEAVYFAIQELIKERIYLYPISYTKPSSGKYWRRRLFKAPELIILGGGTIIKKKNTESYLKLFSEYHKKFPSAKLVVFGSGVADPNLAAKIGFPTDAEQWTEILNKSKFIAVRGDLSKSILSNDWRVIPEINILHDPALYFKRNEIKKKLKEKRIGINFCNIIGRIYGLDQNSIEVFAVELVTKLITDGWKVYLYPTAKSDIPYMTAVLGEELKYKIHKYHNYENLDRSLNFLESLDVFIGQRLHSIIFAANVYTPFHAIEYESKTSDFLESLGLSDGSTRTDNINVNAVMNNVNILYSDLENKQKKLFELVSVAHAEQMSVAQKLLNQY